MIYSDINGTCVGKTRQNGDKVLVETASGRREVNNEAEAIEEIRKEHPTVKVKN